MARTRRWIPVLFILALLGAAPVFVGAAWWRAYRRVKALADDEEALQARTSKAEYRRPSLFGDPLPENGWLHFEKALFEIDRSPTLTEELAGILNSAYPVRFPPPSELSRLRDECRGTIDQLFLGLRCDRLRRTGTPVPLADLVSNQTFLIACAEAERQAGHDAEGLRLLCAILSISGDYRRGVSPSHFRDGDVERYTAVLWREVLSNHALTAAQLEAACRMLDRIERGRPTIYDAIRIQHEEDRSRLVTEYPAKAAENEERPELRHLWSWTFKLCELLDNQEQEFRAILALEGRPAWEVERAVAAMEKAVPRSWREVGRPRLPTHQLPVRSMDFIEDALGRSRRDLIRVATALAWYQVETGRMPERLADLVPRYLPRDPVCPATGTPFPYEAGVLITPQDLRSAFSREAGGIDWPIHRRS
jgi:hypothetical protein